MLDRWREVAEGRKRVSHHKAAELRAAAERELAGDSPRSEFEALCTQYDRRRLLELEGQVIKARTEEIYGAAADPGQETAAPNRFLMNVRSKLLQEKEKMFLAEAALEEVSSNIQSSVGLFTQYRTQIVKAQKSMGQVIKKAEQDGRYLRAAWVWFCGCCAYIILRKFLVLKLLKVAFKLTRWLVRLVTRLLAVYVFKPKIGVAAELAVAVPPAISTSAPVLPPEPLPVPPAEAWFKPSHEPPPYAEPPHEAPSHQAWDALGTLHDQHEPAPEAVPTVADVLTAVHDPQDPPFDPRSDL